ncbi:MAG: hypothetical protein JO061_10545, partial [Acidobacteriaceae bacterium]|nr:hypothetical protein [Acidobacteriaceae bacterium]
MKKYVLLILIGIATFPAFIDGQGFETPPIRFCPAGLQPDGYIDWQKLPPPTPANFELAPNPLSAVIPVSGVTGLNVTVQVPGIGSEVIGFSQSYVIDSALDLEIAPNNTVTLIFDKPVKGISASVATQGRFARSATMTAYNSATGIGKQYLAAQLAATTADFPSTGEFSTAPLQMRSEDVNIQAVVFEFDGSTNEYSYFLLRNVRVETGSAPDPANNIPKNGLRQWLRADKLPFQSLTTWPDASDNGADATPIPGLAFLVAPPDGLNCSPVVQFDGSSAMAANLPISSWTEMTIFMVASAEQDVTAPGMHDALFWGEAAPNGVTFLTPSQSHVYFRFGTAQAKNPLVYTRPSTIAGDYSVTTAMHHDGVDSLWVNGLPAFREAA